MPRKPVANPRPRQAPKKIIDWEIVDKYLIAGCSGTEVASTIGVCPDTLYDRCQQENGVIFSEYSQRKKEHGCTLLRSKQLQVAMQGNTTMLVWLGKQRLDQKDQKDPHHSTVNLIVKREEVADVVE